MKPQRKKLLVAAVGVAAINYAACSLSSRETSGNLMSYDVDGAAEGFDGSFGSTDANPDQFIMSGNLMAPIEDAGADVKDALPE
jgi:hypothetical protein